MMREYDGQLLDITAPVHGVEVSVSPDGTKLWVNVDGVCVLRVCRAPRIEVEGVHLGPTRDETKAT